MTYAEAIEYLQPIADSSILKRYRVALNKAIRAMQEMQKIEAMKISMEKGRSNNG